jgi:hypothetical protein
MSRQSHDLTDNDKLVEKLTTLRPGTTESQPDHDRDDMFSDPTPYFSLKNNFGLTKTEWEKYRDSQKVRFRATPGGPNPDPRRRSAGKPSLEPESAFSGAIADVPTTGRSRKRRKR